MKAKHTLSLFLAICLLCGLCCAFAADAGSAQDPLISRSYVDNTYPGIVLNEPLQRIRDSITVLQAKLKQASGGATISAVSVGGKITAAAGSSFTLLSGSASVTSLTGTLIDLTAGSNVAGGQQLTAGHRYVAGAGSSATVTFSSASRISALGSVTIANSGSLIFIDVKSDAWFYNYVSYAVSKGLINGKSTTAYSPDENLKINEAIKIAACMHQLYNTGSVTLSNGSPTWYSTYLQYAANNGIISKTYPNYDAYISRSEFVAIFHASLPAGSYAVKNSVADNSIPDVKSADANAAQIYAFYRAGILNGKDAKGSFYPAANILRSEVAAIITRMFETDQRVPITLQ